MNLNQSLAENHTVIEPVGSHELVFIQDENDTASRKSVQSSRRSYTSTHDTVISNFDCSLHCRYCFIRMQSSENHSACKCSGMLCESCLKKELQLTFQRSLADRRFNSMERNPAFTDPKLRCTVCNHQYKMQRSKLDIEQSTWRFLKYIYKVTFPKRTERDMSVFANLNDFGQIEFDLSSFLIPIQAAKVAITTVAVWILFTLTIEIFGGPQIGDGRVITLMFDAYLIMEVLRVTKFIDFPERVWLLVWYFLRLVIVTIWAVESFMVEKTSQGLILPSFNWQWLSFYVAVTIWYFAFEVPAFVSDVHRRALKQNSSKIQVNIVPADNSRKVFGPFTLNEPGRFGVV